MCVFSILTYELVFVQSDMLLVLSRYNPVSFFSITLPPFKGSGGQSGHFIKAA